LNDRFFSPFTYSVGYCMSTAGDTSWLYMAMTTIGIVVNSALYSVKKMLKYMSKPLYIVSMARKKLDIDSATFFMNENRMSLEIRL
jgi:hypothetical protein